MNSSSSSDSDDAAPMNPIVPARPLPPVDPRFDAQGFPAYVSECIEEDIQDPIEVWLEDETLVGAGSSGTQVFRARWHHETEERDYYVAFKTYYLEIAVSQGDIPGWFRYGQPERYISPEEQREVYQTEEHLLIEATVLSALRYQLRLLRRIPPHPSIVELRGSTWQEGGAPELYCWAIYMDYIDGHTLEDMTLTTGLNRRLFKRLVKQLASAIAHMHEHNVVHADIEPSNVMVKRDLSRVVVVDIDASAQEYRARETNVEGNPRYYCPVKASGRPFDSKAADMFALGLTILEAKLGIQTVMAAQTPNITLQQLATQLLNSEDDLDSAVISLLAPQQARRPTAQAFYHRCREYSRHR